MQTQSSQEPLTTATTPLTPTSVGPLWEVETIATFAPPTNEQNSGQGGQQTSNDDSHKALIISLATLALVVVLVVAFLLRYAILRCRKKRRRYFEATESKGYLDKERGIAESHEGETTSTTGTTAVGSEDHSGMRDGRGGSRRRAVMSTVDSSEGSEENGGQAIAPEEVDSFNPLDMVVRRSVIISMDASQITRTSNPPPPYGHFSSGNGSGVGIDRVEFRPQRISSLGPLDSRIDHAQRPERETEGGFASIARLLPGMVTVQHTFEPTRPDEVEVNKGDRLRIIGVYDDGWCLCRVEGSGKVGVLPLACLDIPELRDAREER